MPQISGLGATHSIDLANLGPTSSLQLMFAKLQLELSETAKSSAMDKMNNIKNAQNEQKEVSSLLNQARQAQADAKTHNMFTAMSPEMVTYMDQNKLAYDRTGSDTVHYAEEWKVAISSLEARLEVVGTDTQQQMVFVQDFMGQYNSYLQGANAQISSANQTLTSLARGQ